MSVLEEKISNVTVDRDLVFTTCAIHYFRQSLQGSWESPSKKGSSLPLRGFFTPNNWSSYQPRTSYSQAQLFHFWESHYLESVFRKHRSTIFIPKTSAPKSSTPTQQNFFTYLTAICPPCEIRPSRLHLWQHDSRPEMGDTQGFRCK